MRKCLLAMLKFNGRNMKVTNILQQKKLHISFDKPAKKALNLSF